MKLLNISNNYKWLKRFEENKELGMNTVLISFNCIHQNQENIEKKYFYSYIIKRMYIFIWSSKKNYSFNVV